jgi:uncharacterized repeat protein (TIGR03803 family)
MNTPKSNKFLWPGGAWRAAWACLAVVSLRRRVLPALAAGLGLMPAGQATAQTFTTLYNFTGGSDGGNPAAGLILSSNTLYGTASTGGNSGNGTVFAVNTDGTGFTTLYSFTNGSDGALPEAGLVLSGNTLYGTAVGGGSKSYGTVFAVNTDGTGFTTLYSFTLGIDGGEPYAGLVLSGNTLYGEAVNGGSGSYGTVFAIHTNDTGFATLHRFTATDGIGPLGTLILSGHTLYGTAEDGGDWNYGTVFAVNTNGTGFSTLHSFTSTQVASNSDGAIPVAGLVLSGNTLYGTASAGGTSENGTVFAVNTDGTGFTTLHSFTAWSRPYFNSDGIQPVAGLILSGNTLYGTAVVGGSSGDGTVFAVNTDGTCFTNLYSFTGGSDGAYPQAGLILSGNTLYGTAAGGIGTGYGTVFSLSVPSQLTIILAGTNVVLTWPTNTIEFSLQSTTNLGSSAFWTINSPAPVLVNGQNTVTNLISGTQQFYRLSQ